MQKPDQWHEDIPWDNPIAAQLCRPHLGEIIFPTDATESSSDATAEANRLLALFYCSERENEKEDIAGLEAFLHSPDKQLFIVEGEIGAGKTWFLRYNLLVSPRMTDKHFGIVDLMRVPPGRARAALYRALTPILESYFRRSNGSAKQALLKYAKIRCASQLGTEIDSDSAELAQSAHAMTQHWLRLAIEEREEYVERLLEAVEQLPGPLLFLVLDNLDRAAAADQDALLDLSIHVLRNARIRLIVPLRRTSTHLRDHFKGLHEVRHQAMALSPVDIKAIFRKRFSRGADSTPFDRSPRIVDGLKSYTYPDLCNLLLSGETGELLVALGGTNARVAMYCVERLMTSRLIRGLQNLGKAQFAIAALMLADDYVADDGAPILNLFDNEERGQLGGALVRYRVLERLFLEDRIDLSQRRYVEFFESRGYEMARVRRVIARFLQAEIVIVRRGLSPDELLLTAIDEIGEIEITSSGRIYFDLLLRKQWYFAAAKRGLVVHAPSEYVSFDKHGKYHYMTHTNMIDLLKAELDAEKHRQSRWKADYATHRGDEFTFFSPAYRLAEAALLHKSEEDSE